MSEVNVAPHVPVFVGPARAALEELFTRYPTRQACLLPVLDLELSAGPFVGLDEIRRGYLAQPPDDQIQLLGIQDDEHGGRVTAAFAWHTVTIVNPVPASSFAPAA